MTEREETEGGGQVTHQEFLAAVGTIAFRDMHAQQQSEITEVFASQNVDGVIQLVEQYGLTPVQAIACALDASTKQLIEVETDYYGWMNGVLSGDQAPKAQ